MVRLFDEHDPSVCCHLAVAHTGRAGRGSPSPASGELSSNAPRGLCSFGCDEAMAPALPCRLRAEPYSKRAWTWHRPHFRRAETIPDDSGQRLCPPSFFAEQSNSNARFPDPLRANGREGDASRKSCSVEPDAPCQDRVVQIPDDPLCCIINPHPIFGLAAVRQHELRPRLNVRRLNALRFHRHQRRRGAEPCAAQEICPPRNRC